MRRGSEMITRTRDDVIEAKVVLLGSQGEPEDILNHWISMLKERHRCRQDISSETIHRG